MKKLTKSKTKQAKRVTLVLIAIAVILTTYTFAYKLIQNKFLSKKTSTEQNTGTRVVLPPYSPETKKQDNKLEWNNLTITYPEGPFNAKVEVMLSGMGHLYSPEFDAIESYLLAVYPKDKEIKDVKLLQPLSLKFNLEYFRNRLSACGYDPNTLKVYIDSKDKASGRYGVEELKSNIDTGTNSINAGLTSLRGYQQYGIFTNIVIGAKPTKYLRGCGEDAEVWIEGEYLTNKIDNFKIKLPNNFAHPAFSEGLVNNRLQIPSVNENEPEIMIVSQFNWQGLKINNLGNLRYPSYEMSPDNDYYEGETNKTAQLLNLDNQDFLEVKTSKNDNETYRLLTTYNIDGENNVFVIEVIFNNRSSNVYDKYIKSVRDIAKSFSQIR